MIIFQNTYFTYNNKPLINDFSCTIQTGEKVVLYGPSGAGKSTILSAILGFTLPDSGQICVDNIEQCKKNAHIIRKSTAYLPQELSLPYNTVKELFFSLFEFKANKEKTPNGIDIAMRLSLLGLNPDILSKKVVEISGGEKQRLLIASVSLLQKPLLLLDEPTSALDAESVLKVMDFIHSLNCTVIAVSHDTKFIDSFNHKIFIPKL